MMKIIFILFFLYFNIQNGFGLDDIHIEMLNFESEEMSFRIEITVTNNSDESYWFHYDALQGLLDLYGNILYYAPNFSFSRYHYRSNDDFFVQVMEIPPQETINKIYIFDRRYNYDTQVDLVRGVIRRNARVNFSDVQYINMTFIFFNNDISEITDQGDYYHRIYSDGIIIVKYFKVANYGIGVTE